jgi:hypothetical protein
MTADALALGGSDRGIHVEPGQAIARGEPREDEGCRGHEHDQQRRGDRAAGDELKEAAVHGRSFGRTPNGRYCGRGELDDTAMLSAAHSS